MQKLWWVCIIVYKLYLWIENVYNICQNAWFINLILQIFWKRVNFPRFTLFFVSPKVAYYVSTTSSPWTYLRSLSLKGLEILPRYAPKQGSEWLKISSWRNKEIHSCRWHSIWHTLAESMTQVPFRVTSTPFRSFWTRLRSLSLKNLKRASISHENNALDLFVSYRAYKVGEHIP